MVFIVSCEKDEGLDVERNYTKIIERTFANDFEATLIDKAEAYYPPRDSVVNAARSWVEVPETKYWYYDGFDGVYIPYAITIDAINYYEGLIDTYNASPDDAFFIVANFTYKAEVEFFDSYSSPERNSDGVAIDVKEFTSVYVVTMELSWDDYCGSLCAAWIKKERIVVFNQAGEILDVFLDGKISVPVS